MTKIKLPVLVVMCATSFLMSCDDDEVDKKKPTVQFEDDMIRVPENTVKSTIHIQFDRPASQDGVIDVVVSGDRPDAYTLDPAPVDNRYHFTVVEGQSSIAIDVFPVDNEEVDGDKGIGFFISSVSEELQIGTNRATLIGLIDDEGPGTATFEITDGSTREDSGEFEITVSLSGAVPGVGEVHITPEIVNGAYGEHFITMPAVVNGKIILPVAPGADHVSFKVIPINNELYNDSRYVTWSITETQGAVSKGANLSYEFTLNDDELAGRAKGYEADDGNWQYKRKYIYDEFDGTLKKVVWEQHTPGKSTGEYLYFYNDEGQILKIRASDVHETTYTWIEGKITRSDVYTNGERTSFTTYRYYHGQVEKSEDYRRQPNGEFLLTTFMYYLYHTDGNLHEIVTFVPVPEGDLYVSTERFQSYHDKSNPFPMVESLPLRSAQLKLPGSYFKEEGGSTEFYEFEYEFDANGNPTRRTSFNGNGSEVAVYQYY